MAYERLDLVARSIFGTAQWISSGELPCVKKRSFRTPEGTITPRARQPRMMAISAGDESGDGHFNLAHIEMYQLPFERATLFTAYICPGTLKIVNAG